MTRDSGHFGHITHHLPRRHVFAGRLVYAQPYFELHLLNGSKVHLQCHDGFEIFGGHLVKVEVVQRDARYYDVERIHAVDRDHSMSIWWRVFEEKFNKRPRYI